jgi:hypothetical protein
MVKTVQVLYDGEVLRPQGPLDLEPDTSYVITIERAVAPEDEHVTEPYPLSAIAAIATDMHTADLATKHDRYAHGRLEGTDDPA